MRSRTARWYQISTSPSTIWECVGDFDKEPDGFEALYEHTKPFVTVQRLFTDNGQEDKASKFELIESQEQYRLNLNMQQTKFLKQFYLYMQIVGSQNYIKVYSIVFGYDNSTSTKFTVSPVKKVRYIEDCLNMWSHKFIDFSKSLVEFSKPPHETFREENIMLQKNDPLRQNHNIINEAYESNEAKRIEFSSFLNFQSHKKMMTRTKFKDSIVIQDKSGMFFRLFLGKECIFEFTLKDDVFRHKLLEDEQGELVDIIDGVFRIRCARPQSPSHRIIHLDKGMPSLEDPLTITILNVFLSVYDSKIYHTLVRDVILNCLSFNTIYANPVTYDTEDVRRCNFKETNLEEHLRITTYFCHLLTMDDSTNQLIGQWEDLAYSPYPRLQDTFGPNSDLKKPRSSSDEVPSLQKVMSGEYAWQILNKTSLFDKDLAEVSGLFDELDFTEVIDSKPPSPSKDNKLKLVMPKISLTLDMFSQFRIKLFKYLHLLYEDLKLNVMMAPMVEKLGFFLYCYANFLNTGNVVNYIDYYARDNYRFPYQFVAYEPIQLIDKIAKRRNKPSSISNFSSTYELEEKLFDLEMLEEDPFDMHKHLSLLISNKEPKRYPILFQRSYFVYSVFLKYFKAKSENCYFRVFKRNFNLTDSLTEPTLPSTPVNRVYFFRDERTLMEQKLNNLFNRISLRNKFAKGNDEVYLFMIENKFCQSSLETFGVGVRTVFESIIKDIRANLPSYIFNPSLPKGAYTLINREDIFMNVLLYPEVKPIRTSSSYMAPSFADRNNSAMSDRTSHDLYYSNYSQLKEEKKENRSEELTSKKLASYLEKVNTTRCEPGNLVFNEIQRVLSISDLIRIKAKYIECAHEDAERFEYEAEAQVLLRKFAIRRMSVLVGRGAVTINTDRSLFTEVLNIPKINFTALIESTNRKLSLEKKDESINWPEFHSGVSVGLKIPRDILEQKNKDTLRTWIDYQKTNYESYDKPGLIYALGLQGLLYCFLPTDIYLYLKPFYEPRSIGIMLGLAASKLGSRDENIMKAAAVHLACMLPENTDLQLAMNVECAALVSIGLLYKGTCNKQFSQIMLREILAKPNKEKNFERER